MTEEKKATVVEETGFELEDPSMIDYRDVTTPKTTALAAPDEADIMREQRVHESLMVQERSYIDKIAGMKRAAEIFKQRADLLETCRVAAISSTEPEDWVITRDREGRVFAMATAPACDKIAELYGINIENVRPTNSQGMFEPEEITEADGSVTMRAWCDAFSRITGRRVFNIEASRNSSERFLGRSEKDGHGVGVVRSDHRNAVWTLLRTKATRVLSGCARLPEQVLKAGGLDTSRCTKGHGFGSAQERAATRVADEGVVEARDKLRDQILKVTGGDTEAARGLLKEITSFEGERGRFEGYDKIDRITKMGMVRAATKRLKEHPIFGEKKK